MRKLMLINPHPPGNRGEEDLKVIVQMPLNLAYIAALTPPDWEVDVIDETQEPAIDGDGNLLFDADLVGITSLTYQAPRTYEIAKAARKAGIKVVLGGPHPSTDTDEAVERSDAVVKGEAELIWGRLLDDFQKGTLRSLYEGGLPDLAALRDIRPDREMLTRKYGYRYSSIITTKGCPWRCDFCSVPIFQGRQYRERPVADVLDEMESISYRGLMLAEDNFFGYSPKANARARQLFKGMVERGIKKDWFGFTQFSTGLDLEALEYMSKSGGLGMLIGIESTDAQILRRLRKGPNLKIGISNYQRAIDNIHANGMIVWGSMIFGADGEGSDVFKRTVDFVLESGIDVMTFGFLTAMPRTRLFSELQKQGRLFRTSFPDDWIYYSSGHLIHTLEKLSLDEFIAGMEYVYESLFDKHALRERARESVRRTGSTFNSMFAYRVNLDWKNVFRNVIGNLHTLRDSGVYHATLEGSRPSGNELQ
jgi:radical SAM superfamily enzyme YgiQ (UPF0313 family)